MLAPLPTTACESDDPTMSLFEDNSMQRGNEAVKTLIFRYVTGMTHTFKSAFNSPSSSAARNHFDVRVKRISLPQIWPFWRNKRPNRNSTKFKYELPFDNNSLFSLAISKA